MEKSFCPSCHKGINWFQMKLTTYFPVNVNNCGETVDVLSYINFSNKTGLNSITEMQFPTSMLRDTPGMFLTTYFRWHFGIFKMCTNWFSNVTELLIFFYGVKKWKRVEYTNISNHVPTIQKGLYLDGKYRNGVGLGPKIKVVRHLWYVITRRWEGMEEYANRLVEAYTDFIFWTKNQSMKFQLPNVSVGDKKIMKFSIRKSKNCCSRSV